jgi:hypothetical protein
LDGSVTLDKYGMTLLFQGAVENPIGRPVVMDFLRGHMKHFITKFNATGARIVVQIFSDLSDYLHTEEDLMEVYSSEMDKLWCC